MTRFAGASTAAFDALGTVDASESVKASSTGRSGMDSAGADSMSAIVCASAAGTSRDTASPLSCKSGATSGSFKSGQRAYALPASISIRYSPPDGTTTPAGTSCQSLEGVKLSVFSGVSTDTLAGASTATPPATVGCSPSGIGAVVGVATGSFAAENSSGVNCGTPRVSGEGTPMLIGVTSLFGLSIAECSASMSPGETSDVAGGIAGSTEATWPVRPCFAVAPVNNAARAKPSPFSVDSCTPFESANC